MEFSYSLTVSLGNFINIYKYNREDKPVNSGNLMANYSGHWQYGGQVAARITILELYKHMYICIYILLIEYKLYCLK